jgi:anti-anti-sigma factor
MNITTEETDGVTTVVFEGSLDTNTAPDAEAKLGELLTAGAAKILIDFAALDYISSAGLRVLLVTGKKLGSSGGSMRLCNLNETVDEVFEISGFSTIFNVFKTRDDALAGF